MFQKPGGMAQAPFVTGKEDALIQINEARLTSPIAHIRMFVALAKRGLFQKVQQWNKAPEGLKLDIEGGLEGLKGMIADQEVKRCLKLSLERLKACRTTANDLFRTKNALDEARFEYWGAAQLGAALLAFDDVTNGKYESDVRGARKELAICLGNAAEMALGEGFFDRALVFAKASLDVARPGRDVANEDLVEETVVEKNRRRIERAREGLRARRVGETHTTCVSIKTGNCE